MVVTEDHRLCYVVRDSPNFSHVPIRIRFLFQPAGCPPNTLVSSYIAPNFACCMPVTNGPHLIRLMHLRFHY
jgi:hypothetical protein